MIEIRAMGYEEGDLEATLGRVWECICLAGKYENDTSSESEAKLSPEARQMNM